MKVRDRWPLLQPHAHGHPGGREDERESHQAEADALFARLGKHKTGKSCLYITRLAVVDLAVLERLVELSWDVMNEHYPE